jgi:hypothetical protein
MIAKGSIISLASCAVAERNDVMLKKMFCCYPLQNVLSGAGERGLSAVVVSSPEGLIFMLQSRGIDFGTENKLGLIPSELELFVNSSASFPIKFCPFCGKRLEDLVSASLPEFQRLSEKHLPYYPPGL